MSQTGGPTALGFHYTQASRGASGLGCRRRRFKISASSAVLDDPDTEPQEHVLGNLTPTFSPTLRRALVCVCKWPIWTVCESALSRSLDPAAATGKHHPPGSGGSTSPGQAGHHNTSIGCSAPRSLQVQWIQESLQAIGGREERPSWILVPTKVPSPLSPSVPGSLIFCPVWKLAQHSTRNEEWQLLTAEGSGAREAAWWVLGSLIVKLHNYGRCPSTRESQYPRQLETPKSEP